MGQELYDNLVRLNILIDKKQELNNLIKNEIITKDIKQVIRWNKSLSSNFDQELNNRPTTFEFDIYSKFFECKTKEIYLNIQKNGNTWRNSIVKNWDC